MAEAEFGRIEITGLTSDSRSVKPGNLFAALPGTRTDGRAFVADAVERGASAVLAPTGTVLPAELQRAIALVTADNAHRALARMAATFHRRQPDTVVAVTGTNGKTSTVWFLRQIWTALGRRAAGLGTLGIQAPGIWRPGSLTTPDPVALHAALATLADMGVDALALEASSHGLAQHRLDGVRMAAAAFTNLTRDHLDYHASMGAYRAAKLRLFAELLGDAGAAVVEADTPVADHVAKIVRARGLRLLTFGRGGTDVRLDAVEVCDRGQRLTLQVGSRRHRLLLPLVGDFQVANALCAATLAMATGGDAAAAIGALTELEAVPGRLQCVVGRSDGAAVYVDYAHTPDALAAALRALRPHTAGRLVVVFGAGGDRDAGKRPQMGEVAARHADAAIVTDDNPRSESPAAIRAQVRSGCPGARDIGDRAAAIRAGMAALGAGDVLLVAGKGHETGQTVGDTVLPFDDAEQVGATVREAGW